MSKETRDLRKMLLNISALGRDGNLQSGFSSMEILWTLYDRVLELSPILAGEPTRERFILSKGQSTQALLTILGEKGFFSKEELKGICQYRSRFSMQADRTKIHGVEISAGSLGHGFPMAAGIAWAQKIQNRDTPVYILAGDGELNEGTMWETAAFAASEKLNNLVLIVDDNHSISQLIDLGDLGEKLSAFGFETLTVDGHDEDALETALKHPHKVPLAILANTVRGYGSKTLMEDRSWFHRYPKEEELLFLLQEVDHFSDEERSYY